MKFNLSQYTKSDKAVRLGINNNPSVQVVNNLKKVHKNCIKIAWEQIAEPKNLQLIITSGYRSAKLNKIIGSKPSSQHIRGQAVDFEILGISNFKLWYKLINIIPSYDQLILEFHNKKKFQSGWVHISYVGKRKNRMQHFTLFSSL